MILAPSRDIIVPARDIVVPSRHRARRGVPVNRRAPVSPRRIAPQWRRSPWVSNVTGQLVDPDGKFPVDSDGLYFFGENGQDCCCAPPSAESTCGCIGSGPDAVRVMFQNTPEDEVTFDANLEGLVDVRIHAGDPGLPSWKGNAGLRSLLEQRAWCCRKIGPCFYRGHFKNIFTVHSVTDDPGGAVANFTVSADLIVVVQVSIEINHQHVEVTAYLCTQLPLPIHTDSGTVQYNALKIPLFYGFCNWGDEPLPRDCAILSDDTTHTISNAGIGGLAIVTSPCGPDPAPQCLDLSCNTYDVTFTPINGNTLPSWGGRLVFFGLTVDGFGHWSGNIPTGAPAPYVNYAGVDVFCTCGRNLVLESTGPGVDDYSFPDGNWIPYTMAYYHQPFTACYPGHGGTWLTFAGAGNLGGTSSLWQPELF